MSLNVIPTQAEDGAHSAPLHIVSITDYGAVANDSSAEAIVLNDAAFVQAIAFAKTTVNNLGGGAEIYVPPGNWYIGNTITIENAWGVKIQGFGCRVASIELDTVYQGSWICWRGIEGGTILRIGKFTQSCNLINFGLLGDSGGNLAGVGVRSDGTGGANILNNIDGLYVYGVRGSQGIAVYVGEPGNSGQTSNFCYQNMILSGCVEGVRQVGTQTNDCTYRNVLFQDFDEYGFRQVEGDSTLENCNFESQEGVATADVYMEDTALWSRHISSFHETTGCAYLFGSGTSRTHFTELLGVHVQYYNRGNPSGKIVDYQSTSPVVAVSCQWALFEVGVDEGTVDWSGIAGGSPSMVCEIGCQYFNGANQILGSAPTSYIAIGTTPGIGDGVCTAQSLVTKNLSIDVGGLGVHNVAEGTRPSWTSGTGSPEGIVYGVKGSLYSRDDGGAATCLYVKETATGNTGWVAK